MTTAFALFILGVADLSFSPISVLRCHGQLKDEMARLQDIQSSDVFILTNEMKRLRSQQDINVENEQYAIAIRMRLVSAQLAHRRIGALVHRSLERFPLLFHGHRSTWNSFHLRISSILMPS
jgi:hypothetical protein